MNKKSIGIALCSLALAALVSWIMLDTPLAKRVSGPEMQAKEDANGVLQGAGGPAIPARRTSAPLPDLDTPLKDSLTDLRHRVASGDAAAACRLAVEYTACRDAQSKINEIDNFTARTSREDIATLTLPPKVGQVIADATHCDGVRIVNGEEIAQLWLTAARGGHVPSMVNYAVGNSIDGSNMLDNLDALAQYKRYAPGLALKAARAGDFRALLSLASAYTPGVHETFPPLLAQATGIDVEKALALHLHARHVLPHGQSPHLDALLTQRVDELERQASPAQRSAARHQAADMAATWPPSDVTHLGDVAGLGRTRVAPVIAAECAQ